MGEVMRGSHPLFLSVPLLVILGGSGTVAQTNDAPLPAAFTATLAAAAVVEPGTMAFGETAIEYRGLVEEYRLLECSDPRFSGSWAWVGNRDQHTDPNAWIWQGVFRVETEEGA